MLSQKRIFILTATAALFSLCATPLTAAGEGPMNWASDLASAQAEAVKTGKLLLIHFSGERCAPCVRVERNVFGQANVCHQIGTRFVPVHINATAQPSIARQFQVSSWPTDLVLTANGQELHRMTSPQDPRAYLPNSASRSGEPRASARTRLHPPPSHKLRSHVKLPPANPLLGNHSNHWAFNNRRMPLNRNSFQLERNNAFHSRHNLPQCRQQSPKAAECSHNNPNDYNRLPARAMPTPAIRFLLHFLPVVLNQTRCLRHPFKNLLQLNCSHRRTNR